MICVLCVRGFFLLGVCSEPYIFPSSFLFHVMQTLKGSQGKGDGEILMPSEHRCEVLLTVESAGGSLHRQALNCFKSALQLGDRGQKTPAAALPCPERGCLG